MANHDAGWAALTMTELAVAKFLCDGLDHEAVAQRLDVSVAKVSEIITRAFDKLGVASRVELVILAVSRPNGL